MVSSTYKIILLLKCFVVDVSSLRNYSKKKKFVAFYCRGINLSCSYVNYLAVFESLVSASHHSNVKMKIHTSHRVESAQC